MVSGACCGFLCLGFELLRTEDKWCLVPSAWDFGFRVEGPRFRFWGMVSCLVLGI